MSKENKVRNYILENIEKFPEDIVAKTMEKFGITRMGVNKHMNILIDSGEVIKHGTTRDVRYEIIAKGKHSWKLQITPETQEDRIWEKYIAEKTTHLSKNVQDICVYGFTEIFNNLIDHSESHSAIIEFEEISDRIIMSIEDHGIGIFKKIQKALSLSDARESILHLSKGKLTTDPQKHSGEGIFFSSRAFDEFSILSGNLEYICMSKDNDWLIQQVEGVKINGTLVTMKIDKDTPKELQNIFEQYTDEDANFSKTDVYVKMAILKGEKYISRSQAKRLLIGLDKFKKIIFDFKEVPSVGQAFVDEVFRVFKNQHPQIELEYQNTNENVEFMIRRGIA